MNYKKEQEIMSDFDGDKYIKAFCKRQKCRECEGTDCNGEPNGYGCKDLNIRIDTMYQSIYNRRVKGLGID